MRRFAAAVRLLLAVQRRSGFIHVYFAVGGFTIAVVRLFIPEPGRVIVVPALLLGEYGTMGVVMVAAQRYLARNERSTEALAVTPLRKRERVLAMLVAPGLVAVAAGTVVFAGSLGIDARSLWLIPPLFATAMLAGALGLILSSRYDEFTRFLLGSMPVIALFFLPFLSYFELVPRYSFAWLPWDAALFSFANLASGTTSLATYTLLLAELVVFTVLAIRWAEHVETAT